MNRLAIFKRKLENEMMAKNRRPRKIHPTGSKPCEGGCGKPVSASTRFCQACRPILTERTNRVEAAA